MTAPMTTPGLRDTVRQAWRLARLVRPYWRRTASSIALSALIGVLGMVLPYLSKLLFDDAYPAHDVSLMHLVVLGACALGLGVVVMTALQAYYTKVVGSQMTAVAGLMMVNHLQHLPIAFFESHQTGELLSRYGDLQRSLTQLTTVLQTVFVNGMYLLLVPFVLVLLDWKLTMVAIVVYPVMAILLAVAGTLQRRSLQRAAEANASLSAYQFESLTAVRLYKVLGAEREVYARLRALTEGALREQLAAEGIAQMVAVLSGVLRTLGLLVFSWYAWTLILSGELSLGTFVAFQAYTAYLTVPVGQLAGVFTGFQQTAVSLARAFEYLDEPVEQDPATAFGPVAHPVPRARGVIDLRGVAVRYGSGALILDEVDLRFEPGTVTAIVGPSGAGKSSIVRLVCRMLEPARGHILLDDARIDRLPLSDLRSQVGVVWQDPTLIHGTIRDNLTLGCPEATDDAVDEVVRLCRLDELIASAARGYDTPIAEWGASLSGGQRQRVGIARVLLRDSPILLLDEATSQIDVETEEGMLRDLFVRWADRTLVLVTHRPATAMLADRICVLEGGRITASGDHRSVVDASETYRRMLSASSTVDDARPLRIVRPGR